MSTTVNILQKAQLDQKKRDFSETSLLYNFFKLVSVYLCCSAYHREQKQIPKHMWKRKNRGKLLNPWHREQTYLHDITTTRKGGTKVPPLTLVPGADLQKFS